MTIVFFYSLIFGILVTLFGYFWGANNHISHIPIILRILDKDFLKNDFYTNAAFISGQRLYHGYVLAFFSQFFSLKGAYFLLTLISNIINIFVISLFVYKLFKSKKAAIIAAFLTTQPLIEIGGATFLTLNYLIPHTLAVSFALMGVYAGFFINYFLAATLFSLSVFIHPLLGVETVFLCLGLWFVNIFMTKKEKLSKEIKKILISFLPFFISFYYLFIKSYKSVGQLSDQEFIYIDVYFRNPHHHLFYTIDKITWLITFCFIFSMLIIIFKLSKRKELKEFLLFSFLAIVFILLIVFLGFYFTEVKPIKFIAAAQTLRLFYFLKFLGIILIAGFSTFLINKNAYLLSFFNPIGILFYFVFDLIKTIFVKIFKIKNNFLEILYYFGLIFLLIWLIDVERFSRLSLIFLGVLLSFLLFYEIKKIFYLLSTFLTVILIFIVCKQPSKFIVQKWFSSYKPNFEISYVYPELPKLSTFVEKNTDKTAIFLTPADFGQFRFLAKRAIVVDFKGFLFNEKMKEWYQRIIDIYGKPKSFFYYFLVDELNENYKKINDQKLINLKNKYNFSYAILFKETKTQLPVIYEYGNFKIVDLKNLNTY